MRLLDGVASYVLQFRAMVSIPGPGSGIGGILIYPFLARAEVRRGHWRP